MPILCGKYLTEHVKVAIAIAAPLVAEFCIKEVGAINDEKEATLKFSGFTA